MLKFALVCRITSSRQISSTFVKINTFYGSKHIQQLQHQRCSRAYSNRNILRLDERGLISNVFPEPRSQDLLKLVNGSPQCIYAGFDPTAGSLHVGNLLILVFLIHCQRGGHQPIVVLGGATARVGDPSGKCGPRMALSVDEVTRNEQTIVEGVRRIFDNHEKHIWKQQQDNDQLAPVRILNNRDWIDGMPTSELLSVVGRNLRMGQMMSRHSVKSRLEGDGLSFAEFSYQALQAYDFLHLYRHHDCKIQIGGSDQWGNIITGHDLIQRVVDDQVYGITLPLVTSEQGQKFGKSEGNAVWLNDKQSAPTSTPPSSSLQTTSAYELYQFFLRTFDNDVERMLNLFTFYHKSEIKSLMERTRLKPETRYAQKALAKQLTLLVHGERGVESALRITDALFKGDLDRVARLSEDELREVFSDATVQEQMLSPGITVKDMAMRAACFSHEHDAVRVINAGGFYVNQQRVTNHNEVLVHGVHILPNMTTLARVGKRNYYIIKWKT